MIRPAVQSVNRLWPNVLGIVAILVIAAACSPTEPSPTSSTRPLPSSVPIRSASPIATPLASPDASADALVPVDRQLLDILPPSVGGLTIEPSPEAEAESAADPGFVAVATSFAAAVAVDPGSGDFVFAAVVALPPGRMTADLFRDWRDSFDEGACSQAGGVVGNAEAEIGGRTVHIGSCDGGLHTYHAWLDDRNIIVSASAVGAARLGEQLMDGLR